MAGVDPQILQWGLGVVGTVVVSGIGYILRTLGQQNKALALLLERVGTVNVESLLSKVTELETRFNNSEQKLEKLDAAHEGKMARIASLEADMSRVWGIYDAWKVNSNPLGRALQNAGEHQP